jgi:trehalose 2-sulfotransferase
VRAVTRSYVICTNPRSGSHLLALGLADTALCGHPDEYFPPLSKRPRLSLDNVEWLTRSLFGMRYDAEEDRQYVRTVIDSCTSANGVFGLTIHWYQVDDALRRIRTYLNDQSLSFETALPMAFPNLAYIWLRRRDVIAQAVSLYRAICSRQWHSFRSDQAGGAAGEIPFDFHQIQQLASALKHADDAWQRFFAEHAIQPYILTYESFCQNYETTISATLRHLGIDIPRTHIRLPRVQKMAGAISSQWVQRYKMLAEALPQGGG